MKRINKINLINIKQANKSVDKTRILFSGIFRGIGNLLDPNDG